MTTMVSAAEEFVPPSAPDFWQPLVGDGAFAITRTMVVMVLSTIVLAGRHDGRTRRLSVVPGRGQFRLEGVYGLVRNSIAPRHHRQRPTSGPTSRCCSRCSPSSW